MMRIVWLILFMLPLKERFGVDENASDLPAHIIKKIEKEVSKFYDSSDFVLETRIDAPETQIKSPFLVQGCLFEIMDNSKSLGYAFYGVAPSRTDTFDYLLILDQNLVLIKAKILIYREDYGGEISSKRWLSQFYEKPLNTQFQVGESVSGISGATISVRSMTQSVNVVFSFLKNQNILHESSD